MRLCYDEDLVEAAVLACAARPRPGVSSLQTARFNRERERLYDLLDPDERNAAFFRLHLEWFREWGLEELLTGPLKEFPLLPAAVGLFAFRKARGKIDEGAELYVNEDGDRSAVMAMQPERLEREVELAAFLRHEFMHMHDMVDPGFGYQPELAAQGRSPSQRNLARERYRLVWDITVDGRLVGSGRSILATRDQRWAEFAVAFGFWSGDKQQGVFDALWTCPRPTHRTLSELACDPRGLDQLAGPLPGAPCPLCGFPTFAWAAATDLAAPTLSAIRAEFPRWTPQEGVCARCHEVYRVQARLLNVL